MTGVLQVVRGAIVVCEPTPFWTPALQRALDREPYIVRGCRHAGELDVLAAAHETTVIVYELASNPAECLAWLAARRGTPRPTVVMGSEATAELESVCRELGAHSFIPELISRTGLADLCRRWMQRLAAV